LLNVSNKAICCDLLNLLIICLSRVLSIVYLVDQIRLSLLDYANWVERQVLLVDSNKDKRDKSLKNSLILRLIDLLM